MFHNLTTPKKRNKSSQNQRSNKSLSALIMSTSSVTRSSAVNNYEIKNINKSKERLDTFLRNKLENEEQQKQKPHQPKVPRKPLVAEATNPKTLTTKTSICHAVVEKSLVNCCRDVNCHFNALPNAPTLLANGSYSCTDRNKYSFYDAHSEMPRRRSTSQPMQKSVGTTEISRSTPVFHSKNNVMAGTKAIEETSKRAEYSKTFRNQFLFSFSNVGYSNSFIGGDIIARLLETRLVINVSLDILSWLLFFMAFLTRFYRLSTPAHIVFDELHYGKYVSYYVRNMFFFDQHPPLGKQLIAAVAYYGGGYDGNTTFPRIGAAYGHNVPIFWLRFLPALCGSLLSPVVYKLLQQAGLSRWTALLGGLLVVFDNALLTQSRFILMESMLLLFSTLGLYALIHFRHSRFGSIIWLLWGFCSAVLLTCAISVKYAGFFTFCLAVYLMCRHLWDLLYDCSISDVQVLMHTIIRLVTFTIFPIFFYLGIFYIHLRTLSKAGPHDSAMTSAFQASLEGGLASITRGQPLNVVHGSQITLRHTHGRTCWLHSHNHVYPVRYPDKRGSSHQQQVTCYSFKDVNNWWIVKRPERDDLVVGDEPDPIYHGDIIQLVHGITSRALNSHDVAAPMTPQCQEVSCYIDYNIKMESEMLWRVDIINKDTVGNIWHAIKSEIRLIHTTTGAALRFSGRQLPDWGFNQHEVVADRAIDNRDAIWNVEEHRYTKAQNERERERQLLKAEMLPTKQTTLSFWEKFIELQSKMLWHTPQVQSHMYSSEPLEWPLLERGIAYWVDSKSNGQIHLLGNIIIWYSCTIAILVYIVFGIFYLLRRRRLCYDIEECEWKRFLDVGDLCFVGYLFHYLPYFLMDRTLFLHNYLPALIFKIELLCFVVEHIDYLLRQHSRCFSLRLVIFCYRLSICVWMAIVIWVFWKFLPLSYGIQKLTTEQVMNFRWRDTWDFVLQRENHIFEKARVDSKE